MRNKYTNVKTKYSAAFTKKNTHVLLSSSKAKFCRILLFFLAVLFSAQALAFNQDEWWFNIELIVVKRDLAPSNNEDFSAEVFEIDYSNTHSLLNYHQYGQSTRFHSVVAALPSCALAKEKLNEMQFNDINLSSISKQAQLNALDKTLKNIITSTQNIVDTASSLSCNTELYSQYFEDINGFQQTLVSDIPFFNDSPHLLTEDELYMKDLAQSLSRQRDISLVLHTAWRENVVFGAPNAKFMRITAGEKLHIDNKLNYDTWSKLRAQDDALIGSTSTDQSRFFTNLKQALKENRKSLLFDESLKGEANEQLNYTKQSLFEIDGKLKVYLDYVNQIPYLHIESEFMRHTVSINENKRAEFSKFPFKQRRRIISKQIHYFDHPAFGLIVRLERFLPPQDED